MKYYFAIFVNEHLKFILYFKNFVIIQKYICTFYFFSYFLLIDKHKKIHTNHIINNLVKQTHQVDTVTMILRKLTNAKLSDLVIGLSKPHYIVTILNLIIS